MEPPGRAWSSGALCSETCLPAAHSIFATTSRVRYIVFAKDVTAATGGTVSFEEAMQRFTNMQPKAEMEESPEDEAEDATEAVDDPEDEPSNLGMPGNNDTLPA